MDLLDWVMYGAGGAFGLLTLGLGFTRVSSFADRDIMPIWWYAFIVVGAIWAVSLIGDWVFPIEVTVYLANGGDVSQQVEMGSQTACLPAKSYDGFTWRVGLPHEVVVKANKGQSELRFEVGRGTWLINASPEVVTADMYDRATDSIDFEGLFAQPATKPYRVNAHFGRPFRMFTQSSMDRAYDPDGDIRRHSHSGPCTD